MTRLLLACLPFLLCLLPHVASSQAIAPLAPTVVRLEIGDVAHQPLIGLDTATYGGTRRYVASADRLLLVRAGRIAQLERAGRVSDSVQTAYAIELRRCQAGRTAAEADTQRMRAAARVALASPPRPPWLLDSHTYKGVGAGAVLAVLLKVFIFR